MKLSIKYALLGFVVTLVPLAIIDFTLQNAFLTKDGYINNHVVGNILSFQVASPFLYIVPLVLILGTLLIKDYVTRKKAPYRMKGNERIIGIAIGLLLTALLLLAPWLQPEGYQQLLGLVIIFVTILFLRRKLRTA